MAVVVTGTDTKVQNGLSKAVAMLTQTDDSATTFTNSSIVTVDAAGLFDSTTDPAMGDATVTSLNELLLTKQATGFTIAGGTTSRTLTVDETKALSDKADVTYIDGLIASVRSILYRQIADNTITNTTDELSVFDDTGAVGTRTLPANFFELNKVLKLDTRGVISTGVGKTRQLKVKLGSTVIGDSGAVSLPNSMSGDFFMAEMYIKCTAVGVSGSVTILGYTMLHPSTGFVNGQVAELVGSPTTIDTTQAHVLDITYQWGDAIAGNSVTTMLSEISY